jgi:hypothetical protein
MLPVVGEPINGSVSDETSGDRASVSTDYAVEFQLHHIAAESSSLPQIENCVMRLRTALKNDEVQKCFVVNYAGARYGGSMLELVAGVPVDPKVNPVQRHSTQYLADQNLMDALCSPPSDSNKSQQRDSIVTAVGFMGLSDGSMNRGMVSQARVDRLAFISLDDQFQLQVGTNLSPPASRGQVISFEWSSNMDLPVVLNGVGIVVAFGWPYVLTHAKYKPAHRGMNATVSLTSQSWKGLTTTNRRSRHKGIMQTQAACPDCRRPVEIQKVDPTGMPPEYTGDIEMLVTVVCDNEDVGKAIETGNRVASRFPNRVVMATSEALLTDQLRSVWTTQHLINPLTKWTKKRGLQEYSVPAGFVTPILFPRNDSIKETMYCLVQALGVESLFGHRIWLMDPAGENGLELVPSKEAHEQILGELRDWNHPCHKSRDSAVTLIHEWISAYGVIAS